MLKIIKSIFGGGPSLVWNFAIVVPMITAGVWAFNSWIASKEDAAQKEIIAQHWEQTAGVLSDEIYKRYELAETDQKSYANLLLVNEALQSAKEQAILELNKAVQNAKDGDCNGNDYAPARELWVLEALARELTKPESLYGGCAGTATGCAASRLRDAIEGRITEAAYNREDEVRGYRDGADQITREAVEMRLKQRRNEALETTKDGTK